MADNTKDYINKPFNARPVVLWAFFVFLTIIMCFWAHDVGWWVIAVWFVMILGFFTSLQILHEKVSFDKTLSFFATSRAFFLGTMMICVVVVVSFALTTHMYSSQQHFTGQAELRGIVRSVTFGFEEGSGSIVLSGATFGSQEVRGRVRINFRNIDKEYLAYFETGNVVSMPAIIRPTNPSSFSINNNIRYSASVNQVSVNFVGLSGDLRSVVMRLAQNFLGGHMSEDSSSVIYSMLFGDKSSLEEDVRESFSLTGLAHVLAVSGLHVGLIVGLLVLVLRFLRIPKRTQFFIILLALLTYAYLADFRYSIIRASIMFSAVLFGRLFVRRRIELISSICLAGIIIMIIWPYAILAWSFQLSFACLVGIALFSKPTDAWLRKIIPGGKKGSLKGVDGSGGYLTYSSKDSGFVSNLREATINSTMLYVVTTITTFPLLISYFSYFPIIGLVANILLLPLLIVAFQLGVIAITTYIGYPLLYLADWIVFAIVRTSDWLASIPWGSVTIYSTGAEYMLYFAGLVALSRFTFIKKRYRYISAGVLFGLYGAVLLVLNT